MSRPALVFLVALVVYLPTVRHRNLKDCGGSSRMATVESLVERGTFVIDDSTFAYSCDVMRRDGRFYSDKPPVLSVAAALVYGALHHGLGLSFDRRANPEENQRHDHTYALMTALLVATAQALLVVTFDRGAGELGLSGAHRLVATASVAFATLLWPLAGLFNPHTVTALLLLAASRWLWVSAEPRPLAAGIALGFAATVDLPIGGLALVFALALTPRRATALLGALPALLAHAALNWWVVGDLKPFQLHRQLYGVETGHAGPTATGFAEAAGTAFYAGRNLFGALGVFTLTPLLALALGLSLRAALRPGRPRQLALHAVLLFTSALALYVVVWPQAVGCSYGMRHVTPAVPALLLVAAAEVRGRVALGSWTALAALSAILAAGGIASPTTCAGFLEDSRGLTPARVFVENLRSEIVPRLGRWLRAP